MLPSNRSMAWWRADDGTATLEFITAGVLLLVPLVYLVVAVAGIQAGALAVEGAARQAARVYAMSPSSAEGADSAARAVEFALTDHGFDSDDAELAVSCTPVPGPCPSHGATVTVSVRLVVPLPLVPNLFDFTTPAGIPLQASASQKISRFWGAE